MTPTSVTDNSEGMKAAPPGASNHGALDGYTILRFAHAFETGGGVERYLDDLDRSLLSRSTVTIVRLFIGDGSNRLRPEVETIGRGTLIRVPLPLPAGEGRQIPSGAELGSTRWKHAIRNRLIYQPLIWKLLTRRFLASWRISRRPGQVVGAGRTVAGIMGQRRVDLIMLHFFGGADADEIVREAARSGTPFAVLNHFSNDRFLNLSMRKHTMLASGVAGVSGLGLPEYVRKNFCNLSDGIDTDFFQQSKAGLPPETTALPLILLPARIVRSKGHLDLVKAAAMLRLEKIQFAIGFAGRADSPSFIDELRTTIDQCGIGDRVHFLGELPVERLRDCYAACAVVAFPTYHHEGLPRISLEAQAMQVPIIAYATGGVAESIYNGHTGYLLNTGDVDGLRLRIRELLADTSKRKEMGEAGRRWVLDRFSLEALDRRHEQFYLRIIASHAVGNSSFKS